MLPDSGKISKTHGSRYTGKGNRTGKDEGGRMEHEKGHAQPCLDGLFQRVVAILNQARSNVARSVNTNMVLAYWLIGHEIVQELQGGDERAEYGKRVLEGLSERLNARF